MHIWGQSLDPQHPHKTMGVAVHVCNTRTSIFLELSLGLLREAASKKNNNDDDDGEGQKG